MNIYKDYEQLGEPRSWFFRCTYISSEQEFELVTLPFTVEESLAISLIMEIGARVFGIYGKVKIDSISIPHARRVHRLCVRAYGKGGEVRVQARHKLWQGSYEDVEGLAVFITEHMKSVVEKLEAEKHHYNKDKL